MQSTSEGDGREEVKELPYKLALQSPAWLQALVRALGFVRKGRTERRTKLIETLNLGGKRQLMLVLCDGQRFLVGAGADSIHSIVEIRQQHEANDLPDRASGMDLQMPPGLCTPMVRSELGRSH
jgi:flagellar biogenesis protein FliO